MRTVIASRSAKTFPVYCGIKTKSILRMEPSRQLIHEFKALFHRWEEESDMEQYEILECLGDAVDEYYDEEIVDFESEIELDEEDEE
jgi:hypothetical protein